MKVLLAGANSYIGTHLIPVLLEKGHEVVCLARDKGHFYKNNQYSDSVTVVSGDLLRRQSMERLPEDINVAYYLVSSFIQTSGFAALGVLSAQNFMEAIEETHCRQIITLGDISDEETKDTIARLQVEDILDSGEAELTILNSTMIIGPGSTAVEMFHTLTAKSPILIPQNWIKTRSQPISLADVLSCLEACLMNEKTFNRKFDIGGPEVLQFKQLLLIYIATHKNVKPSVVVLPFLTMQLSAHLLNTLTPVSYPGAQSLIENLKHDIICRDDNIKNIIPMQRLSFKQSLKMADTPATKPGVQSIHSFK